MGQSYFLSSQANHGHKAFDTNLLYCLLKQNIQVKMILSINLTPECDNSCHLRKMGFKIVRTIISNNQNIKPSSKRIYC